ncbi:MAG TPA: bacterial transcriptional activator domain-containing protein [Chloroflexota bacterium]|jgi:DNA-binding SARP family transcriptional activator
MYAESDNWADLEPPSDAPVEIRLLGSLQVRKHGQAIGSRAAGRLGGLLASLALASEPGVSREALLNAVWPDNELTLAGQSLNTLLHKLSLLLSDALHGKSPVVHRNGMYRLNCEAGINVDVVTFQQFARAGDRRRRIGEHARAEACYERAIGVYAGDLFAGTSLHAIMERERLRAWYLDLLDHLASYAAAGDDLDGILRFASLMLANDPCREDAHRHLMRCYTRRGQRVQALRQFQLCASVLQAEFGVEPEEATTVLLAQIRSRPDSV